MIFGQQSIHLFGLGVRLTASIPEINDFYLIIKDTINQFV